MDRQAQEQRDQQDPLPTPAGAVTTASDALWREAELEDALVLASRLSSRREDPQGGLLIGDPRGQRVEGLKADIRHALGPAVGRVMRRDLLRAMLRHKGVNPKRLVRWIPRRNRAENGLGTSWDTHGIPRVSREIFGRSPRV
ncbi:uncharacterized protein LOC127749051 [Frankliniella occidentalis]|uniref:Uncharacterized protein LOC127749051 n=1 Tax=Frankliniella occidentalis TaxID=133901 RepID=A0A9C6WMK0_FRAOC|nr:uncharacterized protein LOC127749051 [Frankliniella occidentalis]